MEASVVSSVASTTVAANAGEDATLEFNEGEGDPNEKKTLIKFQKRTSYNFLILYHRFRNNLIDQNYLKTIHYKRYAF